MAEKTQYLEALETLLANSQIKNIVSLEGRFYDRLRLLLDFARTNRQFEILNERLKGDIVLDADIDVDYDKWSNKDTWKELIDDMDAYQHVVFNSVSDRMSTSNLMRPFMEAVGLNKEEMEKFYKKLNNWEDVTQWDGNITMALRDAVGVLCKQLEGVKDVVKTEWIADDYERMYDSIMFKYSVKGDQYELRNRYEERKTDKWTSLKRLEYVWDGLLDLEKSGFLDDVELSKSDKEQKKCCEKEIGDVERLDGHHKAYMELREFAEVEKIPYGNEDMLIKIEINKGEIGEYVYKNRKKMSEAKLQALVNFMMLKDCVYRDVFKQVEKHKKSWKTVMEGVDKLCDLLDENKVCGEKFDVVMVKGVYKELLDDRYNDDLHVELRKKFMYDTERSREDVPASPFLFILGMLSGLKRIGTVSVTKLKECVFVADACNNSLLKNYVSFGRNKKVERFDKVNGEKIVDLIKDVAENTNRK